MNLSIPLKKAEKNLENVLDCLQKGESATLTGREGLPVAVLISLREMSGIRQSGHAPQNAPDSAEIARSLGLLADLPSDERVRADLWQNMSEEEKESFLNEFYNLELDRSLSDIIIENRE